MNLSPGAGGIDPKTPILCFPACGGLLTMTYWSGVAQEV
jgi:hypothetical protein